MKALKWLLFLFMLSIVLSFVCFTIIMPNKQIAYAYIKKQIPKKVVADGIHVIEMKKSVHLDVPIISQLPELARGCEVTSLAMLLRYFDYQTTKLKLAQQIKKDDTPYSMRAENVHFGNPNNGFVGNMRTLNQPGLGVYVGPIEMLAKLYAGHAVQNLTHQPFEDLKIHLSKGEPIWVIINTTFHTLPDSAFQIWDTPTGKIKVTKKEHAVVITGYDNTYVYVNDPLTYTKDKKVQIKDFVPAWEQMGSQALTIDSN